MVGEGGRESEFASKRELWTDGHKEGGRAERREKRRGGGGLNKVGDHCSFIKQ